jgi:hypothetical protein
MAKKKKKRGSTKPRQNLSKSQLVHMMQMKKYEKVILRKVELQEQGHLVNYYPEMPENPKQENTYEDFKHLGVLSYRTPNTEE